MQRKDTRPLTVNGKVWEYKIGKNNVAIYDPQGKRYFVKFSDIHNQAKIDSGRAYLNPATILNHIQTKILGTPTTHERCNYCDIVKSDVILRSDPFDVEIYDDNTEFLICDSCFSDREDDI